MAEKIRIQLEVVELDVNDNGDIIKLPVSDELFNKKLASFVTNIEGKSKELEQLDKTDDIIEIVDKDIEFHTYLKDEFNNLFGEDAYVKVFGEDTLVGAEYILEFISLCLPYIKNYSDKRATKLSKYSANRVGSSL